MEIIEFIRKYNHKITALRKGKNYATPDQAVVITDMISMNEEVVKDLQYIAGQMPSINPIDKGGFNDAPEGLKEITLEEWHTGFGHYCIYERHSKQVRNDGKTFDLMLFDIHNFDNKKMGWAIMNDWFDKEKGRNRPQAITRFCRYGKDEDWKAFESRFAAQFAGDNS